jgi:uncharacterized protein YacL
MGVALLAAEWIEKVISKKFSGSKIVASAAKISIIILAVFMTLNQLGIAPSIVNSAFIIILGAVAIAFAIAFGIGGRDFARNVLQKSVCAENKENSHSDTDSAKNK